MTTPWSVVSDPAARIGLGLFMNAPGIVVLWLVARVFRRRAWLSGAIAASLFARPVLYTTAAIAGSVQALGFALIGTRFEGVSRVITIYPGSAVFYLVPRAISDLMPELVLGFIGATSALFSSGVAAWLVATSAFRLSTALRAA